MNARTHISLVALALASPAAIAQDTAPFAVSGDLRLRFEQDWDSQTASGAKREERTRARIRARINAKAELGNGFVFKGRVRTGGDGSQQNANITFADFDDNRTDELKVVVDQYSLVWQGSSGGVEAGRMAFPFFTANEYFWDGDVSPLGVAGNASVPMFGAKLKLNAGGFKLPIGLRDYAGDLFAGQAVLESGAATVAAGVFGFDADVDDSDRRLLLDGNGSRDYTILAANAQYKFRVGGKALVLNADLYQNLEDYARTADAISRANRDERTGYVVAAAWGDTNGPGHLQVGYRYFHIEKLAVNASYAHDDVARFGTAAQAALTDLEGHDVYANCAITSALTIGVRAMIVERLSNREDAKRARVDFIYKL